MEYSGPRFGVGAAVTYTGNETVGKGGVTISASDEDSQVKMDVVNNFAGENKTYTVTLEPSENAKTTRIVWTYDVDYGWDLMARPEWVEVTRNFARQREAEVRAHSVTLTTPADAPDSSQTAGDAMCQTDGQGH